MSTARRMGTLLVLGLAALIVQPLIAQTALPAKESRPAGGRFSVLSLAATPYVSFPIGADAEIFGVGAGAGLSAAYRFPRIPLLSVESGLSYGYLSTPDPSTSISTAALYGGIELSFQALPILSVGVFGDVGWFLAFLNGPGASSEGNPLFALGLRANVDLADSWSLGVQGAYRYYAGLFSDVALGVGTTYRVPARPARPGGELLPPGFRPLEGGARGLRLVGLKSSPIFPVFYNYYDDHPLAEVALRNFERAPAQAVRMTALVKGYMDGERECEVPVRIDAGDSATAQVFALFNDRLLEVAESTKLTLVLAMEYSQYGRVYREEYSPSIDVLFRNAMTWDDSRKMAAFISARDPAATGFARGVLSAGRDARNSALSQDLQSAMLLYEALRTYGLAYVKDPSSALNTRNREAIDSLQFPQQTLEYRSGDCDDLSILMCSLLESVGIETAFITTPGHVFPAFAIDLPPQDAAKTYGASQDFIVQSERAWIPLEMTNLSEDFLGAWKDGARQWHSGGEESAFYSVHDAWGSYAPVVVSGTAKAPPAPETLAVKSALRSNIQGLINRELTPRAAALLDQAKKTGGNPRVLNSLGILYARYGLYDKAADQFTAASRANYRPAQVNLGNTYLAQRQYRQAAEQFRRLLEDAPADPVCLVGAILAANALGDREGTRSIYANLKAADPSLAERYAFVGDGNTDSTARAASAESIEGTILWQE